MSCKRAYMKKLPNLINPGDVFRKNEHFESVWIVKDHVHLYGHPPHVHIAPIDEPGRPLTYAVAALNDPNLFQKV